MKKNVFIGLSAIFASLFSTFLFVNADTEDAVIQRTDTYSEETDIKGGNKNVMQFSLTNNYSEEVEVSTINLLAGMDQNENVDLTLSGSGFSFTGNTGTLTGSGSVITLNTESGFSLSPSETKSVTVAADIDAETLLSEFQLKISDVRLASGSGVSIFSGTGLSLSNPLKGTKFKIAPSTFTLSEQFPLDDQDIVATNTKITGKIGGSFDITGYSLNISITQNGSTFMASNYTASFSTNDRTFSITPTTNFTKDATINVGLTLTKNDITITGPTMTFVTNTISKASSYFDTDKDVIEDIIIPIDFDNQEFTFTNKVVLKPKTEIEGVNTGLNIEIDPNTLVSKKSGTDNSWGGEMKAPAILSVPSSSLFNAAVGKSSKVTFVPKKRFEVGSENVSLIFSQPITFTVPVSGAETMAIYYSQDGTDWYRHGTCTLNENGFCVFRANHFTQFAIGEETSTSSGSSSRQNHMRYGDYDPENMNKHFNPQRTEPNQLNLRERSNRQRLKYIPCDIAEDAHMTQSLYNLKLSQGAPTMCREAYGGFRSLPYRSFKK